MACDVGLFDVSATWGVSIRMQFVRQVDTWILTPWCARAGDEEMARELMAMTGLTAQELVHLARSAFGTASAPVSAARAAAMGIFCPDGTTGDGMGLKLIGNCPPFVEQCIADGMRFRPP